MKRTIVKVTEKEKQQNNHHKISAKQKKAFEVPLQITLGDFLVYLVTHKIGKGGFGHVFHGRLDPSCISNNTTDDHILEVAIKFENRINERGYLNRVPNEWIVYKNLNETYGIPNIHYNIKNEKYFITIMDLLGPSLWDLCVQKKKLTVDMVACVAIEALTILENFHHKGYVHGDIKPENFLMGRPNSSNAQRLYLIDLGLTTKWRRSKLGTHIDYDQNPNVFKGTLRYASVHAHLGRTASRRDDLESLGYTLLFLLDGSLPWQGYKGDHKGWRICKQKKETSLETLCQFKPNAFQSFMEKIICLKFEQEPQYAMYRKLFEPLCGYNFRRQVFASRHHTEQKPYENIGTIDPTMHNDKKKALRVGLPSQQWVVVFNNYKLKKQRYHYNVATSRTVLHFERGKKDGLYISCLMSCKKRWGFVMDARTGYTSQVYYLNNLFLPTNWIRERIEQKYYLTAVAGSIYGHSLVVMSGGTTFTEQDHTVSEKFPFSWVKERWKNGFFITSMAATDTHWAVIVSRNTRFKKQCIELDFHYPSEGVHKRWSTDFRITSSAATKDQIAFVFSRTEVLSKIVTQETLRTTSFPCKYIKEMWSQNMYIENITYGRTIC
eukprot:gnl/TRDRNA2_/TRDRNA2_176882_c2_seq1.p1 gnl/TRDRNA2_/TRDRNA2_176882_c2~~gnl/TRDRNA2_/TRDRNA2_176882_c2_seq1.p1  ORF type:complete len:607 (-),score=-38.17 gnl/TRDRNA2_/TRDRNA2_176882_c2_seq1:73-1893(-)